MGHGRGIRGEDRPQPRLEFDSLAVVRTFHDPFLSGVAPPRF
jgi:hypothetical protein